MIMKIVRFITVMTISAALTACGSKETVSPAADSGTTPQAVETAEAKKEEISAVELQDAVKPAEAEESTKEVYEDNFAVKTSEAKAFAEKIKTAVASKDIVALADLTAFPVYVGIAGGGVENREAFIGLGAEKVFTPGLIKSVEDADISNLTPSMAGFSISKDGKSNIIFGVVEGRLAISGINYEQ